MQPRPLVFFAPLLVLLAAPVSAHAAQIAVLAPQLKPPGATELRDRFHDAVTRTMAKAGEVISAEEVRSKLASQPDLLNCASGACVKRAALALSVERVITVEVEYVGKDYTIRVHAFDAAGNDLGPSPGPEEKCDICTVREAAKASERVSERLLAGVTGGLTKAAPPAPAPAVNVPPVGMTETPKPATPPPAVAANTPPPAVTPKPTEPAPAVTPAPAPTPAPVGGEGRRSNNYRIGAYTAFGVAAVALAATIPFAYYASKESNANTRGHFTGTGCDSSVPADQVRFVCPKVYSGNVPPAVIFGVGAGLAAATGAVLLYLDSRQKRPAAIFIGVPLRDGFAVSTSIEF